MMYSQIPEAAYIPTSPDEVLVKGSSLEGFSLMVEDPSERGLAMALIEAVRDGAAAGAVHQKISASADVTLEETEAFLENLVTAGALIKNASTDGNAAWTAFIRYGTMPSPEHLHPLALCTPAANSFADEIRHTLESLGIACTLHTSLDKVTWKQSDHDSDAKEKSDAGPPEKQVLPAPKVVISAGAGQAALMRFNEKAVTSHIPVLYLRQDGVEYSVGPFVVPHSCACYWEYERQWAHSSAGKSHYDLLERSAVQADNPLPVVGRKSAVAASVPWLVELSLRGVSSLAGEVIRGRGTTTRVERHSIMRLPRCPVCLPLAPMIRTPMY